MKKIFKEVKLNSGWKKVDLKKFNDFYLTVVKKDKNGKKSTLDKDCVRKIRFEVAIDSGKKGKYIYYNQLVADFKDASSSDVEFNKKVASVRVLGYPSTFYIKAVDMTGESSIATEGSASIEVYLNELRLR